jgi:diguanylate cyclase (GGDEF)-like protein/hemerythrin-like metal-binding protein
MHDAKPASADPSIQELIMRLPMSLALIGPGDVPIVLNHRFLQLFDPDVIGHEVLQAAIRDPDQTWRKAKVDLRDGRAIDAQVQAIGLHGHVVLAVIETLDPSTLGELDELRARIAELERTSATDHLTGAWNRAHLDRLIESEVSRSMRFRQPLSLILFDIDHFKQVNDTHGHQAGDAVLCELVQLIRQHIRSSDLLFRWGGEEFVVLAAAVGYRYAETLAETLRASVAEHEFPVVGTTLRASLGVAEYWNNEDAPGWFRRLDAALYAAKQGGRDRVVADPRGNSDVWARESGLSALRLTWLEGYECGEPVIDQQHRELFDLANALIDASFSRNSAPQLFEAALDRLLVHIEHHFACEEALLERHGYARLDGHRKAHNHLLTQGRELEASLQSGQFSLGRLIELIASDIVARHLFTADRDFFALFRKSPPLATAASLP